MPLRRVTAAATAAVHILLLVLLTSAATAAADDQNITEILAKFPEFSTFNNFLTQTRLAEEINRWRTITVCAVNDTGMKDLLSNNYPINVVKNVLSLHVLRDYFDTDKLHNLTDGSALSATSFQASGAGPGTSGIVNITDLKDGKVVFAPKDNDTISATFVKSVQEIPYNLSVIQISNTLPPPTIISSPSPSPTPAPAPVPEAPTPLPSKWNFTAFMVNQSCKVFAETLLANIPAQNSYAGAVAKGLTIFCPGDDALKSFVPSYSNLSDDGKRLLLQYHAAPVYKSATALRSMSSDFSTLATDGDGKYNVTVANDGVEVAIDTGIVMAMVVNVVKDEQPLSIYALDKVLLPRELFTAAPAPPPGADPPEDASPAPESQAEPPQEGGAADTNNKNDNGGKFGAVIFALWVINLLM